MRTLTIILVFFLFGEVQAQKGSRSIHDIELQTIDGTKYQLPDSATVSVIVFLSPTCPLSQKYTLTLNELAKAFADTVKFYGVFAEAKPVSGEYAAFRKKYDIHFLLLQDRKKKLVKALSATVTPEAFVVSNRSVIYHGAIDDWAIALGKTRANATINFVRNAIRCALNDTPLSITYQKPVGCFID